MCIEFECIHDMCGYCSYTDQECEYEECAMWSDCQECAKNVEHICERSKEAELIEYGS